LRIQTLGGLSAHGTEGLLSGEAAQPRRLALLALLARAGDRGISRDRLVGYLWPDADEDRARRSLSQALYSLRQGSGSEELFLGTQELRLNPALVTSDLAEFDSTRREGDWGRAAELYTGPFLDGFHLPGTAEFERWVEAERQTLTNEYAELLERLAEQADRNGEHRSAVGWWRKLAAQDPLNARIALALMRSHVAAGDRNAALRHAGVYQALVEQELDFPADREVLALAERIRTQPVNAEPVSPPTREASAHPALPVPLPVPPASEPAPRVAEAPSRVPVRRAYRTGILLLPVAVLLALWAWSSRGRNRPAVTPAETPLLMVGRIADYGGAPNGGLGRPLADMIATDLARAPRLKVISTARVYEILAQLRVSDTVSAALMSAARHAGATEMLDGALFDLGGGRIRLDLRRVDVATGSVLGAYSVQGSDPFGLADSATVLLVADLGTTAPGGPIADLTTRSLDAYRAYDAGLQDYFRLAFSSAERHFVDAIRADSTFAMASYYYALASEDGAEQLARLNHALRLAAHASDRERLIISVRWALMNAAPNTLALAETLAVRYPAEVDAHLALGHARYMQEDFLGGIRAFDRVIQLDSLGLRGQGVRCAACDAYSNLIAGYATVDSFSAALAAARAWGAAQPTSPTPWRLIAFLSDQVGDSAAAAGFFRRVAALDTNSRNLHFDRTAHLLWGENFSEVERVDGARLSLGVSRSERIDLLWSRMLAQAQQGRFQAALETATGLRREVAFAGHAEREGHPLAITVGLGEAQALRQTGRLLEAAARFDSLARFDLATSPPARRASARIWILTHLASTLAEVGDTARLGSIAASMDSLKTQSGAIRDWKLPHYVLGLLESARGRSEAAAAEFALASSIAGDGFSMPVVERARMSLRLRRPHDAVNLLQRTLLSSFHFYVTHAELHAALAEAWAAAGNRDSARVHLAAVDRAWVRADPPVRARLAQLHARLGF